MRIYLRNTLNIPSFPWIYHAIRIGLGLIFFWSGITKIVDIPVFAVLIDAYGLIPEPMLLPVAVLLSLTELVAGVGLMGDVQWTLEIITGLLILFILVLAYGIRMGLDVDCGCFGPEDPEAEAFHGLRSALIRDVLMMIGVVYLYFQRHIRRIRPYRMTELLNYLTKGGRKE
jgi:uncharacterized membrane protein YphA (DoxX/SURF4 family)